MDIINELIIFILFTSLDFMIQLHFVINNFIGSND